MSDSLLNIGFIPLVDCAPLVVAREKGFAAAEGLELRLVRETSWANIRDRLAIGHFDAAHLLGPLVVAATLGAGHLQVPIVAPVALNLGGNAITVSVPLWRQMVEAGAAVGAPPALQAAALARVVRERAAAGAQPLTFAMVYPFSCQNYELRLWLASAGLDPDADVRLVVLPPPLLADALRSGQIDGFCVGAPWNSLAVSIGCGVIVNAMIDLWPQCPEKVVGMRRDWVDAHPSATAALVRAVVAAARWCDEPDNRPELASLLSEPRHVGTTPAILRSTLEGRLPFVPDEPAQQRPDYIEFSSHWANVPWPEHGEWYYRQMLLWKQVREHPGQLGVARACFRSDLYAEAVAELPGTPLPPRQRPAGVGTLFFERDVTRC